MEGLSGKESLEAKSLRLLSEVRTPDSTSAASPQRMPPADAGESCDALGPAAMTQNMLDSVSELHPHAPVDEAVFCKREVTSVTQVQAISVTRVRHPLLHIFTHV